MSRERIEPVAFEPGGGGGHARRKRSLSGLTVGLWLAGALFAALSWLTFQSVSLEVLVEPAGAEVELRGIGLPVRFGDRFVVRPGEYGVVARAPGHIELRETVRVTDEPSQRAAFVLERLPGRVTLAVSPEGATVSIGGDVRGAAPLAIELPPGVHAVRAEAPRHLPIETQITVEGGGIAQEIALALAPAWAEVTVESTPTGATILVDGEARGTTPANLAVDAGAHRLTLALAGYETFERPLRAEAGVAQVLPPIALAVADGKLRVRSEPAGASVTVDGVYRGLTPLSIDVEPGRARTVRLSRAGYETATRSVTVRPEDGADVRVSLAPRIGRVRIVADPPDAEVRAGGRRVGTAGESLSLVAVPQELLVVREGYQPARLSVVPRAGQLKVVHVALTAVVAPATRAGFLAEVVSSLGHGLVLVSPATFEMGSERRDQGRRSNEVQRQVAITRAFYLGAREITNAELRGWKASHASGQVGSASLDQDDHPAVRVTWADAARYCNWLSAQDGLAPAYVEKGDTLELASPVGTGYRLPTEAEWELAARRAGSSAPRRFPWGDGLPPPQGAGNYGDVTARSILDVALQTYSDGYLGTAPVGSFAAHPLGIFDLGGNVAEWVHDRYEIRAASPHVEQDPTGPATGAYRVIRGASYRHASLTQLRLAYRDYADTARDDVGLRIARYAGPSDTVESQAAMQQGGETPR
jgi:formylglycine-generating enzyme required for sulfatase activity